MVRRVFQFGKNGGQCPRYSFARRVGSAHHLCVGVMCLIATVALIGCNDASSSTASVAQPKSVTTKSGVEMVSLPGGTFMMGSNDHYPE